MTLLTYWGIVLLVTLVLGKLSLDCRLWPRFA